MNSTDREALELLAAEIDAEDVSAMHPNASRKKKWDLRGESIAVRAIQKALSRPSPSGEDVERVARALCAADELDWNAQANPLTSGNGDNNQEAYLTAARAAIAALSLPHKNGEVDRG